MLVTTSKDGVKTVLTHTGDGTWVAASGPSTFDSVYDGETYDARIADELEAAGDALGYYEPAGEVKSRSGGDCIVAMCNQWYINYGDEAWKKRVLEHVRSPGFDDNGRVVAPKMYSFSTDEKGEQAIYDSRERMDAPTLQRAHPNS